MARKKHSAEQIVRLGTVLVDLLRNLTPERPPVNAEKYIAERPLGKC